MSANALAPQELIRKAVVEKLTDHTVDYEKIIELLETLVNWAEWVEA